MMTQETATTTMTASTRHALVLDDNDGNRMLLKFLMEFNGISFEEADTAAAAFKLWQPGKFAFIFLDIELPDVHGLEVLRIIRAADDQVAIIMCSANDDPLTVAKAIAAGCDVFLIKPFQLDGLMKFIKTMDRAALRDTQHVLIVDNTARPRFETRPPKG